MTKQNDQKKIDDKSDNQSGEQLRLSKLMGQRGLCSRREADKLIADGLVEVDGVLVTELGSKVDPNCSVKILEEGKESLNDKVTIALHKPRDYVSSQPEDDYTSALELIRKYNYFGDDYEHVERKGLAPLGRLDIDSTGLILYSQNGVLAKKIIGENSDVDKEYEVNVTGGISEETMGKLRYGLSLDGVKLKRAKVTKVSSTKMIFVLNQGRKRQIRRMCELVGLKTTRIHRIRVGKLKIGDLPEGKWMLVKAEDVV